MPRVLERRAVFGVVALLALAGQAAANPVLSFDDLWGGGKSDDWVFLSTLVLSLLVEYLFLRLLIGRRMPVRDQVRAFVAANLITVIPTQIAGLFVGYLAEVIPLVVEPLAWRGLRPAVPRVKGTVSAIVVSNLLGFAFGLACYHVFGVPLHRLLLRWLR
jgi:hypothetical protein